MRALMLDPEVLLLDEPLGALDPMVRHDLQNDLKQIFGELKKTVVLVTHDIAEAGFLGDQIILLREGQIVQRGTLIDLVEHPAEKFVVNFINAQRGPFEIAGATRMDSKPKEGHFALALLSIALVFLSGCSRPSHVTVGSKVFTESVILGEIATQLGRASNVTVVHRRQLGGTRILWDALVKGEIDIYPEYTGTLTNEIFAGKGLQGETAIRQALAEQGIEMTHSLGFNDTYALGMREEMVPG